MIRIAEFWFAGYPERNVKLLDIVMLYKLQIHKIKNPKLAMVVKLIAMNHIQIIEIRKLDVLIKYVHYISQKRKVW